MERIWQDHQGTPLLYLNNRAAVMDMFVRDETMPEISTAGSVVDVAATGLRMYVGNDELKAGTYSMVIGTVANDHGTMQAMQSHLVISAIRTRFVHADGRRLAIARFSRITKTHFGASLRAGEVAVTFEASSPYWFSEERTQVLTAGGSSVVEVGGVAKAALRIRITAGATAIVNPQIVTDSGSAVWLGTIPSGETLVIDGNAGVWGVTLGALDVHTSLVGRQPFLIPGERTISNNIPSDATISVAWQEGTL